jgi:hypothetical protein
MPIKKPTILFFAFLLAFISTGFTHAAVVSNDQLLGKSLQQIDSLVQKRGQAVEQLTALGVAQPLAEERVQRMTDQEVSLLVDKIDELEAGGSSVLVVAAAIFIVLVITDALGATDIFTFVKPIK